MLDLVASIVARQSPLYAELQRRGGEGVGVMAAPAAVLRIDEAELRNDATDGEPGSRKRSQGRPDDRATAARDREPHREQDGFEEDANGEDGRVAVEALAS